MIHTQPDHDRRQRLCQDLAAISPWDSMEAQHLEETVAWIRSGAPLDRTAFVEPDPHLVAYFVVTDPDREELLLGHHVKSGLRLPAGGHAEPGEALWQTVEREAAEELRLPAVPFLGRRPFFVTRTPTVGPRSHTDVSCWFVLRARRQEVGWFDPGEYTAVEWLPWRRVLAEPVRQLDPNIHRFTRKLLAAVTTGWPRRHPAAGILAQRDQPPAVGVYPRDDEQAECPAGRSTSERTRGDAVTDQQTAAAADSTVREVTASTFLLRRDAGNWSVGLIWHDRLGSRMPAGGHGEVGEGVHDAAVREVWEETGFRARLIPGPTAPTPAGFPHRPVPAPWWICEGDASPDGHTSTPHTHVDHIYLALVDIASAATERQAGHQFTWFTRSRLSSDPTVSEDSRLLALQLMTWLDGAPAGAEDDPTQLSAHLAHQAASGLLQAQHRQREKSA